MPRKKSAPKFATARATAMDYIPVVRRKRRGSKTFPSPSYKIRKMNNENERYHLGRLLLGHTNNVLDGEWQNCRVEFSRTDEDNVDNSILHFDRAATLIIRLNMDVQLFKDILTTRVFAVDFIQVQEEFYLNLYLNVLPLQIFNRKIGSCIKDVFYILSIADCPVLNEGEIETSNNLPAFYNSIRNKRTEQLEIRCQNVQHPRLKPILRPYQADAVRWMLMRENKDLFQPNSIHPLYTEVTLGSGVKLYYDAYTGHIGLDKPLITLSSRGGILADEMGLGKTVEVLACILSNPKENLDCDPSKEPTVKIILKRKFIETESESESDEENYVIENKRARTSDENGDVTVKSGLKAEKYIALRKWYEECLNEVKLKPKQAKQTYSVQCVCGSTSEKNSVHCTNCNKLQHRHCMGYQNNYGPYKCPQCWITEPLVETGATLIVTPVSLRTQWCNEISKHIRGSFNVLQYGGSTTTPVYPMELLNYDVVITTYSVLQNELLFTESQKEMSFRNERKYSAPGCPLTNMKWWRLCLDEAQTVDSPTTKVSEMAQRLCSNYRWAVTGTPISKQISDLYGLIEYLKIEPYNDINTWNHKLFNPYIHGQPENLLSFLAKVLWRSSKNDVLDQINIPKQTTEDHWLDFSAVEQYFYKCEHDASRFAFLDRIKTLDVNQPLQDLDRSSLKMIMAPLLSLRQACTFANSPHTRYLATRKPVNSLKDLLDALILKNITDSEEYLRLILSSLNGLAGIHQLNKNYIQALDQYKEVLKLYKRFTDEEKYSGIKVDKLPVIHAMHNLAEIYDNNIPENLRDETVRSDCEEMEKAYIQKFVQGSMASHQENLLNSAAVEKLRASFTLEPGQWYYDLTNWIFANEHGDDLLRRVENSLRNYGLENKVKLHLPQFDHSKLLRYPNTITDWDMNLSKQRDKTISEIDGLYMEAEGEDLQITIDKDLVKNATDCHLRPETDPENKTKETNWCDFCRTEKRLKGYEQTLFHKEMDYNSRGGPKAVQKNWKDTIEEMVLKCIIAVGKSKNVDPNILKDGETHIQLLDMLKKEFKEMRKFWTCLDQQICAQDELDICKIRLAIKEKTKEAENVPKRVTKLLKNLDYTIDNRHQFLYQLEWHKLDLYEISFKREEQESRAMLEKNIGVKKYLQTLNKREYEGAGPDPCPICKNVLEKQWCIIPCGHNYCLNCMKQFIKNTGRGHYICCCVCRSYNKISQISYVQPSEHSNNEEAQQEEIHGNYSMKIEGIVRLVLKLRLEDNSVKILLFSSWIPVLSHISSALILNGISVESISNASNLEKRIERFKDETQQVTVLLLPISLGGKGLNLIEATHVILTEPLLNPAEESQAIGRVHRIGQTKPTVVHKFFIKDTIEENIHLAMKSNSDSWEKSKITLKQLTDLFAAEDVRAAQN